MTARNQPSSRRERRLAERAARRGEPRPTARRRRIGLGWLSALAVGGGLIVVVLAVLFGGGRGLKSAAEPPIVATMPAGLAAEGMVLGRADAPVTIDLYEDFQCPACAAWRDGIFPRLVANELADGRAKIVFHDFAFLGPESFDAGRAAFAADRQGRFWDMWATLYANQGRENSGAYGRDRLLAMAAALGLDGDRFAADMDSPAARDALAASIAGARRAGVSSTPTLAIAGQLLVGASYPEIAAAIAAAAP